MTETELVNSISEFLLRQDYLLMRTAGGQPGRGFRPAFRWRVRSMDTWKTSGHSDLFALRTDGKFCAFELKTPEGKAHGYKATGDQLQFLAEVQERNGIAKVVYSLEDIWNP